MSNDLNSILARHNLKGINVANFSPSSASRPTPPQQPYQYPVPVAQPRTSYTWAPPTAHGGGTAVRPSFAWPAPPQPRYTIDPRHYSYDIWGKAPVFSLNGEDEDDEESETEEEGEIGTEEDDDAQDEGEGIETDKAAGDAVTEEVAEKPSESEDIPTEATELDAVRPEESGPGVSVAELSAEPPQEEELSSPAETTTAETSLEEETAMPTESALKENEPENPEVVTLEAIETVAQDFDSVPDAIESVQSDNQTSGESIGTADASAEQVAAELVEAVDQDSIGSENAPEILEGPVVDPQHLDRTAENIATDGVEAVKTSEQMSDDPSPTETASEDVSREVQPAQYISGEAETVKEIASMLQDPESGAPAVSTESDETGTAGAPAESDDTSNASPVEPIEDSDEIVQIIDINGNDSTDDTAAIVVVPIPPPPPTRPHVTIAEPIKPPKPNKKKSSSGKSSRSRSVEKSKEKPVEIILLKEGKSKIVATGKGKKKSKTSSWKGGEDLMPPPPPMIVDVLPRAPSPPPSGLVIEIVGDEAVQVVDSAVEKKEDSADGIDVATVPEIESELVEVVEAEEQNVETKAQEEDVVSVDTPPPPLGADDTASPPEDSGSGADGDKPQLPHEESVSQPEIILASAEDPSVDSLPDISLNEATFIEEPGPTEAITTEVESHDQIAPEEDVVSAEDDDNGGNGSSSPESPIELVDCKESTAEGALEEESASAIVETDPVDEPDEDAAPSTGDEGTSPSIEESTNTAAKVVAESTPTLMELVALILPSDSAPEFTEDVSTKEANSLDETSDTIPEAGLGKDNDISGEAVVVVLPDEEDAVDDPPEAPTPPEADVPNTKLEYDEKVEDSKHQTSVEVTDEAMAENKEPQDPPKLVERAPAEEDSGSMPGDQSGDIAPGRPEEIEISDEAIVDEPESSLDGNASPMEPEKTPEADASLSPDDTDIHKREDEHGANSAEEAVTELAETVPMALDEQVLETNAPNMNAPEMLEDQAMDPPSTTAGEPDVVEEGKAQQISSDQELGDTSIYEADEINAATPEEEARANSADDTGAHELVPPAMEQVGEEVAGMTPESAVSEDVIIHHMIDEVEEPAGDVEIFVMPGRGSEQSEQSSEPIVVKADPESYTTPGEHVSADFTKSPDTEDLPRQPIEPLADHICDTTIDPVSITDHAATSSTGDGAQTEEQDSSDLSMPVLAEEAQTVQVTEDPEETGKDLSKPEENETKKAEESVDTAPSLEGILESNETSRPGQQHELPTEEQHIPSTEEHAINLPQLEDAPTPGEPTAPAEQVEPASKAQPDPQEQESTTEAEVLPEDSISQQQSRRETMPDSEPGQESPRIEEPTIYQPAPVDAAEPPPSKHSSKVSFDELPVSTKDNEPISPPKERRKSSKSSSHRHSSSHHKVKDVSRHPSEPQPSTSPNQSRRRSSTVQAPPLGLFRKPSSAKPRSSRAEAAEQAELRRRAAELAAREEDVQRQLRRARRRAALEEQERQLREKEEELARLEVVEREKKRARHEERRRREQEALDQERERAAEAARQKELERAERRRQRREVESSEGQRHRDDRPRVRRHMTEDIGVERQRSRDEYYVREVPSSSKSGEQRRHRRSSRRESDEKPKKGFWKSLLGKV